MLTIKDFNTAKQILSSSHDFGAPSMANYIDLLEKESHQDFSHLKKYLKAFLPFMHGEEHLIIRKQINKLFINTAIQKWIPNINTAADFRLTQLEGRHQLDLIVDILDPLYMDLVEKLFGVVLFERKKFIKQIEVATNAVERVASISQLVRLQNILLELDALLDEQFESFAEHTLFNNIIYQTKDNMSRESIITLLIVLLIAPRATTETIAHIMVAFNQLDPAQKKKYSSEDWVNIHIDDLIRLYASTNLLSKEVKQETKIQGCPFAAGSQVMIDIPAVNRDQSKYKDQIELTQLDDKAHQRKHLTFGSGSHICLGVELAKEIIKVFIPKLYYKYPQLTCNTNKIKFYKALIATRIKNLPVNLIPEKIMYE